MIIIMVLFIISVIIEIFGVFLCDGKACGEDHDCMECRHTLNICHAKNFRYNSVLFNKNYYLDIEDDNDLISRSELKEAIETWDKFACLPDGKLEPFRNLEHPEMFEPYVHLRDIRYAIDNAPTIPLPDFKEGYKQAIRDGKTNFSRPQGEWIGDTDYKNCQGMYERYKCSECGYGIDWRKHNQLMCQDEIPEEYREYYCPHCGSKII